MWPSLFSGLECYVEADVAVSIQWTGLRTGLWDWTRDWTEGLDSGLD